MARIRRMRASENVGARHATRETTQARNKRNSGEVDVSDCDFKVVLGESCESVTSPKSRSRLKKRGGRSQISTAVRVQVVCGLAGRQTRYAPRATYSSDWRVEQSHAAQLAARAPN